MSEPIENLYYNWLCARVVDVRETSPSLTYWMLCKQLHKTEFVWLLSGDDNRAEDGKELRREFLMQAFLPDDTEWRFSIPCSVLEMLIAFSRRAEFMTDRALGKWFWRFIDNLNLKDFSDANFIKEAVDEVLEVFIWRLYDYDGAGGLFPLKNPSKDQRETELWYQFCEYLVEQDRLLLD